MTSSGNPIAMSLKTRYVVKGIKKETTISSIVNISTDSAGKITKVEDRWDGSLPESGIANVSSVWRLASPFWWASYAFAWGWWGASWVWWSTPWLVRGSRSMGRGQPGADFPTEMFANFFLSLLQAFRRLNAVTVPKMVGVPKNDEEDAKRGNQ